MFSALGHQHAWFRLGSAVITATISALSATQPATHWQAKANALSATELVAAASAGIHGQDELELSSGAAQATVSETGVMTKSPSAKTKDDNLTSPLNIGEPLGHGTMESGEAAHTNDPDLGHNTTPAIWSGSNSDPQKPARIPSKASPARPAVSLDVCSTCPYTTIQSAIDAVPTGSDAIVRVAQGIYGERVTIPAGRQYRLQGGWTEDFSSRSNDPSTTVITLGVPGIVVVTANVGQTVALTLDGFRITGGTAGNYETGVGISAAARGGGVVDLIVENCLIDNNIASHGNGIGVGARAHDAGSVINLRLNRTRVVHNRVTFYAGAGLYLVADNSATLNAELVNTLVARNISMHGAGFHISAAIDGGANPGTVNLSLLNSTVTSNLAFRYSYYGGGFGGGMSVDGSTGTVNITARNSIMYGNTATFGEAADFYLDNRTPGQLSIDATFSDIGTIYREVGSSTSVHLGTGTFNADPQFVNLLTDNFRPGGNSPALDAGTSSGAPTIDLDGNPRPIGAGIDIGAYEVDIVPDTIDFAAQTGVPLESWIESDSVTVSGITVPVGITISSGEYAVSSDGGASWSTWRSTASNVSVGDVVKLRVMSSSNYFDTTLVQVQVGSVNASFSATTLIGSLDIDLNGSFEASTDGLLILRYLFGVRGDALTSDAIGALAQRTDAAGILTYLDRLRIQLDVDGDGSLLALTDGLLVLRHLLGLRGSALVNGALGSGATRDHDAIDAAIARMRQ